LMLFFNAFLPNLSSDMQHLNQPIWPPSQHKNLKGILRKIVGTGSC